jgi:hypothetical protein
MYRVLAPMVPVRDEDGFIRHHYKDGTGSRADRGPIIRWLSDAQAAHLLRLNVIERIEE